MKTTDAGPERFHTVDQFRTMERGLNLEHMANVLLYEAMQPGVTLKRFLKEKVLFGNHGDMGFDEMKELAREIFVGERSVTYLSQLRGDNCLGYDPAEEDLIISLLETPWSEAITVALALGYIPPRPRR